MSVKTAVSVIIGAELGSGFRSTFTGAGKQLGALGATIKNLHKSSENITAFKTLGRDTLEARREWQNAQSEVARLANEISKAEKPSKALNASFRNAKKDAALAKSAYTQNRTALSDMSASLKKAGIDTKNLTAEQTRLGKALDTLRTRQSALVNIENKKSANLANRSAYRSQIVDMLALGGTLYGMVKPAIAFESAMAEVKKVVNFDGDKDVRAMESAIKDLSKSIPLSLEGLTQIVAAGGQLGVPKAELTAFAESAAKMSVAFGTTADEAGQSMAKLSNVLQMPIREMSRVGDVINHLSNNMAATAPEIVEVNLRAGAMGKSFGLAYNEVSALAGTFVAMGKTPEIAGTAINMMASRLKLIPVSTGAARKAFNQLGISMKDYTKLIENGNGREAMMTVLEALKKVQGVKRSQIMHDLFGENANRHINSLVEGLDTLKNNMRLVANETDYAGSMNEEFARRSKTTENNLQLLKNQMAVLATNVGSTLLPAINSLVGVFGRAAGSLAEFAEKHPTLTKYIGLAVAGMASMKLATFAVGYGFTFLKGGVLSIIGIFTQVRTAVSLISLTMGGLIPVIKAVGLAFITNPIGLAFVGIGLAVGALIKYWDKVKNIFDTAKKWLSDSWVGKAWNWAFGDDEKKENQPPKIGDTVSETFVSAGQTPVAELPRSNVSTNSNSSSVSVSAPITINATAGMNAEEVARQVSMELNAREQSAARRQRGTNYD